MTPVGLVAATRSDALRGKQEKKGLRFAFCDEQETQRENYFTGTNRCTRSPANTSPV